MIVTELPDTIYLQVGGDEYDGGEPFDTDDVTWCSDNIFDTDVEYRRVKPVENGVDSASWHARFIAEQCGDMARWRRVGLAAFLEDTEEAYGEPLPEPADEAFLAINGRRTAIRWNAEHSFVELCFNHNCLGIFDTRRQINIFDTSPAQLAAALKELYKGEKDGL